MTTATKTTTPTAPYTVRPLGGVAWESGLRSLVASIRSQREAYDTGLRDVVIVGANGEVVDESSEEFADAQIAEEESR